MAWRPYAGALVSVAALAWLVGALRQSGADARLVLSLVAWGIMLGGIVGLGAIGLSLVYGVLRFGNFAHGDLMTVGAYAALAILPMLPQGPPLRPLSFGWEMIPALLLAMALTGLVSVAIDRILYRPLRRRRSSPVLVAMASLGAAFFLRSALYLGWGADFRFYYTGRARPSIALPLGIRLRPDQIFVMALAVVLVVLTYLLLTRTRLGKAMRATADNPVLARVSGIDTERIARWTWLIGGALAGAGGVMLGLDAQLRPEMGWALLLPMFAAAILGGIGNPYGALVGGLVMGVVQQVSTVVVNPAYAPGVALVVMIALLLLRPRGLLGGAAG
ncbi:branched-chain amino acid ABC transporter permease [Geochorda subterranea]|uniref:Branched-chain amino acid ABC transporter permease n=1 Tax=Geochorda subterranea TaxID=3109564 RepID=A0ABZ1BP03_9FIRM|nr:branched-chain amino acid ABC transporter permease [Limnochorda sp. LNt]WRP14414.1 branched-chain amino acid ABC transporter permease [Limnochorda sp. LNt]